MELHDIQGTLNNLGGRSILDDIELFEIKRFALIADEINKQIKIVDYSGITLPSLNDVVELLDPEGNRTAHFFIYSAYSEKLAHLRKKHKAMDDPQSEEAHAIHEKCIEIEDAIRQELSAKLWSLHFYISLAWIGVAELDFMMARARLSIDLHLVQPKISEEITSFTGLFHPQVKALLEQEKRTFHPWDISLHNAPCLITGANMAGKTVLLKTVALNQYLFQFGFYVASFAAEMLNIQSIISSARAGNKLLVLIDEPARTTNPHEGIAIANALIDLLEELNIRSLITTHYSGLQTDCRKLRVKGLTFPQNNEPITATNIDQYMDYSLMEHTNDEVPREALQIAEILGIDVGLTQRARQYADQNEKIL